MSDVNGGRWAFGQRAARGSEVESVTHRTGGGGIGKR